MHTHTQPVKNSIVELLTPAGSEPGKGKVRELKGQSFGKSAPVFSCLVVSNSLQPHGLWHARLPCPSLSPGVCSNSCPLSQWMMPSNHLILYRPLLLLPSIFPTIRAFSDESALCIRWPKYLNFSISHSNEYSG